MWVLLVSDAFLIAPLRTFRDSVVLIPRFRIRKFMGGVVMGSIVMFSRDRAIGRNRGDSLRWGVVDVDYVLSGGAVVTKICVMVR